MDTLVHRRTERRLSPEEIDEQYKRIEEARKQIGFKPIFNSFTSDEIAEIVYRVRTLQAPPSRPPRERRAYYRTQPFAGMRPY
jgi:hypothetical protein